MIINLETNLSLNEIENILSDKKCSKYPFFQGNDYDLGINWVNSNKNFICLFYEDDTKGKWSYQTTVKSFFYGKVIKVKNKYRIFGITCVNIFFIISMLVLIGVFIYNTDSFTFDTAFGILFITLAIFLFNFNIPNGNKKIENYLKWQFGCRGEE